MRLETLRLRNFRCYEDREFRLHPQFNLVVGENGAGKTSFLEAAAIAMGSWLLGFVGYDSRNIHKSDVRVEHEIVGGRYREVPQYPVRIAASGTVRTAEGADKLKHHDTAAAWSRSVERQGGSTTRSGAAGLKKAAESLAQGVMARRQPLLPLIATSVPAGSGTRCVTPAARH